jgi:hypothetical protein
VQRDQVLHILDGQHGLGVLGAFSQQGLGGLQVQLGELFDAGQGFFTQIERSGHVLFVQSEDLFDGHHAETPLRADGWMDDGTIARNLPGGFPCSGLITDRSCCAAT